LVLFYRTVTHWRRVKCLSVLFSQFHSWL
jgi:hypothetical protein